MQEMLIPRHAEWIKDTVRTFSPTDNHVTLASGRSIKYEYLIVAAGLQINWNAIKGLPEALVDSTSGVSSIYSYDTCSKTVADVEALRSGKAIFTQPAGVIKCAGGVFPAGSARLRRQ
jgi:NADH dehydrogenase FAD-containing subunit